jgi:hypothetical protein
MLTTQTSLEIAILYRSDEGREVSFTDLINNRDVMDVNHYEPSAFWNIFGGFEVTLNGHFTIFHNCNFYCLVKATNFLITSLFWIKGKQSDRFDNTNDTPNHLSINPSPDTTLRLQRLNEKELIFSYLPRENTYKHKRGDRYFGTINLNSDSWFEQTDLALNEYFEIMKMVIAKADKSDKTVQTMIEYLKVWQDLPRN